jgi:hypothetical protein
MENELTVFQDDQLLMMAEAAERRINAVIKIKQVALKVTNNRDWVNQDGNPYLMVSGSEKVANLFNISWRFLQPEPVCEEDENGHFTYTYQAEFSMGGRSIQVEGSRSSRDGFFKKYNWVKGEKEEIDVRDRDNKRDVKMAALTNLLGNGITRLLGIRNLTWEDLESFAGIKRETVKGFEYKKQPQGKPTVAAPQSKSKPKEAPPQEQEQPTNGTRKITEAQRKRFYAIAKGSGKTDEEIKSFLYVNTGRESTGDITADRYDELCSGVAVKAEAAAPDPGEDPFPEEVHGE